MPSRKRQPAPEPCVPPAFAEMMQVRLLIVGRLFSPRLMKSWFSATFAAL